MNSVDAPVELLQGQVATGVPEKGALAARSELFCVAVVRDAGDHIL